MNDLTLYNPIKRLTCSEAARITGVSRHAISDAMDTWMLTKGRSGLRFSTPEKRRVTSVQALRDWFTMLERKAASGF